jgi:hypothetical protein
MVGREAGKLASQTAAYTPNGRGVGGGRHSCDHFQRVVNKVRVDPILQLLHLGFLPQRCFLLVLLDQGANIGQHFIKALRKQAKLVASVDGGDGGQVTLLDILYTVG